MKPNILVITADYPGPQLIYGDVFVHTRLMEYLPLFNIHVVGCNPGLHGENEYTYDGIPVYLTPHLDVFFEYIRKSRPELIIVHLIKHPWIPFLIELNIPLLSFLHGYESTSWRRRLMNYNTLASIRYLIPYIWFNAVQLRMLKRLVRHSNKVQHIHFVFVSQWLKSAVEADLHLNVKNASVIPNSIITSTFRFREKDESQRKKILLIRSFSGVNYANDISVKAILILSHKNFFPDLEFSIYGQGYLFKSITDPIAHFPNVKLHNYFVENKLVPELHKDFGIFLCPSRLDSQGVSMCEAMSSGLVPVTSRVCAIPEFVTDNESGFLTESAEEVAERIEFLVTHPEEFIRLSKNARKAVEERCSVETGVKKELALIQSMLNLKSGLASE